MSAAQTTTSQITSIDGVEIIAREPAKGPHPRTRELTTFSGIESVLLADETQTSMCSDCGWHNPNVASVASHRGNTHLRTKADRNLYSVDAIKTVLRAVKIAERDHPKARNVMQLAADDLNRRDVPALRGKSWNGGMVYGIYKRYSSKYTVYATGRPRGGSPVPAPMDGVPTASPTKSGKLDLSLLAEVNSILVLANQLQEWLTKLVARVEAGEWEKDAIDPAVLQKAQRYDQLQNLLGGT